jgi:hypothetical protein
MKRKPFRAKAQRNATPQRIGELCVSLRLCAKRVGANIWITNSGSNTVTKLCASDGVTVGTFSVGSTPHGVAVDVLCSHCYQLNWRFELSSIKSDYQPNTKGAIGLC